MSVYSTSFNIGIFNNYASPEMFDLKVEALAGSFNTGILNAGGGSKPVMTYIETSGQGGSKAEVVVNAGGAAPVMMLVKATGQGQRR